MTARMLEQAAMVGRRLAILLERGCEVSIRRDPERAMVTLCVSGRGDRKTYRTKFYDAGTLDGCMEQIDGNDL